MKIKLVESFIIDGARDNIVLEEKKQLIESSNGEAIESGFVLRNVPVTRYTENLNNRIYSQKLWKKVEESRTFEGSYCMADHSDNPSVKDISGIWTNFKVKEDIAVADIYLIGGLGKAMYEIVKNKGKLGFSTTGFGELLEDDKTVNPDNYEYKSCDWVIDPSQQVFASSENIQESKEQSVKIEEKKDTNIKIEDNEKRGTLDMNDKLLENMFRNQAKVFLKECASRTDYKALLSELEESEKSVPENMGDLKEQYSVMKKDISSKIEKELKESKEKVVEVETSLTDVVAKYEMTCRQLDDMKEKYEKATKLLESFKKNAPKESKQYFENMDNDKAIEVMTENAKVYQADIAQLLEDRKEMEKDIKRLSKESKQLAYAEKTIKFYESLLKKKGIKFAEEDEADKDEKKDDEEEKEKEDDEEMKEDFDEFGNEIYSDTIVDEPIMDDEMFIDDGMGDEEVFMDDAGMFEAEEDDAEDKEDDEDEEDEEEKMAEKKKCVKKKGFVKESKQSPVKMFYSETVKTYPRLKHIQEKMLKCKSLVEAISLFEKFKNYDAKKTPFKLSESSNGFETKGTYKYVFKKD